MFIRKDADDAKQEIGKLISRKSNVLRLCVEPVVRQPKSLTWDPFMIYRTEIEA